MRTLKPGLTDEVKGIGHEDSVGWLRPEQERKDYEDVWKYLKEGHSNWWHHLDSTWIIRTEKTVVQVRDDLKAVGLDNDDELLVAELSGVAAWVGFNAKGSDWLKANL